MRLPRSSDTAALASNWRSVLAADAVVGLIVAGAGIGLVAAGHPLAFAAVVAGAGYLTLVARRWARWRRLRSAAGAR